MKRVCVCVCVCMCGRDLFTIQYKYESIGYETYVVAIFLQFNINTIAQVMKRVWSRSFYNSI